MLADYKEMYLKMFRASEQAISLLIEAQRECEELYISQPEPELKVFPGVSPWERDSTSFDQNI